MSNKPQNIKGMRDHLPEAMILRQFIMNTLIMVFERHGFEPLQTSVLEYAATLDGKIGDDEKLIYRFATHGGDQVALRYDQTVPLARVVGQYQSKLIFPWRRYAIGQSFRGERPARGRYREFWQADVDIIGSASPVADAEIIVILSEALSALGFQSFTTLLNHRQIIGGIARVAGLDDAHSSSIYRSIDKLDKIGPDGVREALLETGISSSVAEHILTIVQLEGSSSDVLEELSERLTNDQAAQSALTNLREIIMYLNDMGLPAERYVVAPRLARGLSYYTGSVFETQVDNPPMGSLLGGGRYDELVGMFAGRSIPTVGLAFGLERIFDVMLELGMGPQQRTISQVFVTLFDAASSAAALRLAGQLREAGLKVETALQHTDKLGKQLKYADQKGIPFALVLGPDEIACDEVVLKNLRTTEQHTLAQSEVVAFLKKQFVE